VDPIVDADPRCFGKLLHRLRIPLMSTSAPLVSMRGRPRSVAAARSQAVIGPLVTDSETWHQSSMTLSIHRASAAIRSRIPDPA